MHLTRDIIGLPSWPYFISNIERLSSSTPRPYNFPLKMAISLSWSCHHGSLIPLMDKLVAIGGCGWHIRIVPLLFKISATAREPCDDSCSRGEETTIFWKLEGLPWNHLTVTLGRSSVALEKGFTSEHLPSLCTRNSELSTEQQQKAPSGAGTLMSFPSGMLREAPSRRESHGSGGGSGCSRALEHHDRHTALSRTRSTREGSRRRTSPKSSDCRSAHGGEDRPCFFIVQITAGLRR